VQRSPLFSYRVPIIRDMAAYSGQPVDLQSYFRAINAANCMRGTTIEAMLADVEEAHHCLDAPDFLPSGSADFYCGRGES